MSNRSNNRFATTNKNIDQSQTCKYRKCAHHIYSHNYAANMRQHDEIMSKIADKICSTDMDNTFNINLVFHFLAPKGTFSRDKVLSRAHDIVMTLNDDFNNYTNNPNTMNNFKYKSIINQVFTSNIPKQNIYLGQDYLKFLPTKPSNITFELGEIYYYPVKHRLNLSGYDDIKDVEIQFQVIKQYIHNNRADAISPENILNIWIIDMADTSIMGFSNFPWEVIDNYHGIVMNRRSFFPEDHNETNFSSYKTVTHCVGHYLGLLHVFSNNSGPGVYAATNINADTENIPEVDDNGCDKINFMFDPTDKIGNKKLHFDNQYNPLFMNFMDCTHDKYVSMFTMNQLQKMRYMLATYRPKLNSLTNKIKLPIPKYNPDTDTISGTIYTKNDGVRNPPLIPSRETCNNPRLVAQSTSNSSPLISQAPLMTQTPSNIQNPFPTPKDIMASQREILKLIPNLSSNNLVANTFNSAQEQIIANIQSNLPNDSNLQQLSQINQYEDMLKKYQSYNSEYGYGKNYPYDPYNMQNYQNNMGLIQQYRDQGSGIQTDTSNEKSESNVNNYPGMPVIDPRYAQQLDPRYAYQTDPRYAQQIDPRYAQQMDPRYAQQIDPRYAQQIDPRYVQNGIYPSMPIQQIQNPVHAQKMQKYAEKKEKRIDPQFKNELQKKNNNNVKYVNDLMVDDLQFETEINPEAVKNLKSQRNYPKYSQARTNTQKNSLDPNYIHQPTNLNEAIQIKRGVPEINNPSLNTTLPVEELKDIGMNINNALVPSNLMDKVTNINEQIQNIKSVIPNTSQLLENAAQTDNKARFNKYGQTSNPRMDVLSKPDASTASQIPKKRFVRSKPSSANN